MQSQEATVANGYPLGRPENREPHALDNVIRRAIEKMPMETRLYPDVYAWSITNAVLRALADNDAVKELSTPTPMDGQPTATPEQMRAPRVLSDEEITDIFNDLSLGMPIDRMREISRRSAGA